MQRQLNHLNGLKTECCQVSAFLYIPIWNSPCPALLTFSLASTVDMNTIQGDSEENVSIFGGDNLGHCEEEVQMNMCLINSDWLPR